MKHSLSTTLLLFFALHVIASEPWRIHLENTEQQMSLRLDLYEESVEVPGMEILGPLNGYLAGNGIFGVWMVTSYEIESDKKATLRMSSDLGSDSQRIVLTQQTDSTYLMELQGNVYVRKSVNRKLVKIPQKVLMQVKKVKEKDIL